MPRLTSVLLALALAAACREAPVETHVRASGHVDATSVRIAPQVGGRIVLLNVRQGDTVTPGTLVLRLDPRDAELAVDRGRAQLQQAEAELQLLQAGARPEDVRQAEAQAQASRDELLAARAELAAAEQDLQRFEALLEAHAGSRKQRDDAATRRDVAVQRVQAAESRVRAVDQTVARLRAGARAQEIDAARARVAAAAAQLATIQEALSDTAITTPIAGIVTERLAEAGEVVAAGTPVVVVTNLDDVWADVFVPEPMIPRIRIGQAATVFTDAGGAGLPGRVSYISPRAEFTPRNVQTADERSKLVYRVRIAVDNEEGILKQGMPVEAEIPLEAAR